MADKHNESEPLVLGFKSSGKQSKRRPVTYLALFLVVVLVVVAIAVSVTLGVVLTRSSSSASSSTTVCNTTVCTALAQQVLNNINTNVDPCQDFYNFSCGGWINKTSLPPGMSQQTCFVA